tara:strand:- start:1107 stop:2306 length:1200 start_codon:yes stop_codon:yes gene_type:complete
MHILEAYSTSCGLKIDKPFVVEKFHGLTTEKYITLHTGDGKFDSRTYDYWQDVVDFLGNFLKPHGISIVQVGSKKDKNLSNVTNCNGKTSINHLAYILKNSLLHLGIDSLPVHIASSYGKKIVALYSNTPPQNSRPYWSKPEDVILLESDKGGDKPTYAKVEIPKTINTIMPDKIFLSVLKLLGIKPNYSYEMLHLGKQYSHTIIEFLPNFKLEAEDASPLFIRMDLCHNEIIAAETLEKNKATIITDKPITKEFLFHNKKNINKIILKVNSHGLAPFASEIKNNSIDLEVFTKLKGDKLNDLKFEFLDICLVKSEKIIKKEDIKQLKGVDINSLFYLPNKFIMSNGKVYDSLTSLEKDESLPRLSKKLTKLKYDEEKFWDESDHICILKKLDSKASSS